MCHTFSIHPLLEACDRFMGIIGGFLLLPIILPNYKLRNLNLLNVTPPLISRNPTEWMFSV